MIFNALTACPYIILGTFGPLVTMSGNASISQSFPSLIDQHNRWKASSTDNLTTGIAGYIFLFLTVFGVLILRVRQPSLKRPYRVIIWAPIFFSLLSAFIIVRGLIFAPIQGSLLVVLMIVGGIVHFYKRMGYTKTLPNETS